MIRCDFDFCIYNEENQCIIDGISINGAGHCENCIVPNIPDELLRKYKQELLDKYENNSNSKSKTG